MSGAIFSLLLVVGGAFALLFIFLKSINLGEGALSDEKYKSSKKKAVDDKTFKYLKDLEEEERLKNKSTIEFSEDYENSIMDKVKRLKRLYKNGTLSKAEFEKAKNKLLK